MVNLWYMNRPFKMRMFVFDVLPFSFLICVSPRDPCVVVGFHLVALLIRDRIISLWREYSRTSIIQTPIIQNSQ